MADFGRRTPASIAEASGAAMYARDNAAQSLGIQLLEIRPGYARMRMVVRKEMLNGHDICHGGVTFTLADTAFAYACNSRNEVTIAARGAIDYVAPARLGELLTAEAREQALTGRTGVYDVTVVNANAQLIALFRGNSYRIKGQVTTLQEENS